MAIVLLYIYNFWCYRPYSCTVHTLMYIAVFLWGVSKHYLLYAAEGDILKRKGKTTKAKMAFGKAYELATSTLDKQFLQNKINSLN